MSLYGYLDRIRRLDGLIRRKSTGPPKELARKLNISERWLYNLLGEIKDELDCPITYDPYMKSYVYEKKGKMVLGFQKELSGNEMKQVSGGKTCQNSSSLYLFMQ